MNQRPVRYVVLVALLGLLAGCSASSGATATTATTSTSTSNATTTSTMAPAPSTLPPSAVSIVKAPVLVAQTSDGAVGYRVVGAGPPLVLIMGYSGSMDAWQPSFVDSLGRAHRVVIFDNAGIGRTAPLPAPLTISGMADQTAALIEALHLGRTDVLGWSMGGMIAQALAVLHPDLVRRLVLCATLPGNGKATAPSAAAGRALAHPSGNAILATLFPAGHHAAEKAYVDGIIEYPHFYLPTAAVDKEQLATLAPWLGGDLAAGRLIGSISVPTLVADGLDDVLVPPANDSELHAVIKGSELKLYRDAGHAFLFQDEQQFVPLLETFLGD